MLKLNETHDPGLRSWVTSANDGVNDFPIQNLPFAVFRPEGSVEFRGGVAIGDQIVDLLVLSKSDVLPAQLRPTLVAAAKPELNDFMAMGPSAWSSLRFALSRALRQGSELEAKLRPCLVDQANVEYKLPCRIGDFTDFYTSVHHATAVGSLFRPDNPLLPNYKWVPIGYHGRASSIAVSGQEFPRPLGQLKGPDDETPSLAPSKRLDYELEMGIFIGSGNELGSSIAMDEAESHVFGMCLLNDWSARDIQAWEYQPLGPFLAKSFASTISPWIVTLEALAPYRRAFSRPAGDPQPLPYLSTEQNKNAGAMDIKLEVLLQTKNMQAKAEAPVSLSRSNFSESYWTVAQMVAHHSVNGCNLQPGDLLGTGTQSGPSHEESGSMLELSRGGKQPVQLPNGETRTFLEDGDTIILRGYCDGPGLIRLGFGEVTGTILPAQLNC
ncbi:fumarylacetoacetase [Pseudohongiella spirulinae]|uniref:fumarylacetoacetase n=1 Tax=Pseudohongiella spirulinae TaxID=1249552 RepID=A0A0S2KGT5_9GAMM|nr:fumarylacetoacetase [Pseudohongiella spirulinae]ALO47397.1 Fumarylacetoacetase [Pseudohongiella spirulinae]